MRKKQDIEKEKDIILVLELLGDAGSFLIKFTVGLLITYFFYPIPHKAKSYS